MRTQCCAVALLVPFCAVSSAALARPPLSLVALSGQQAPGMAPGHTMDAFGVGIYAGSGRITFSANIRDPRGAFIGRGAIVGFPDALGVGHLTNQPAPGLDGHAFGQFSGLRINSAGSLAAVQTLLHPGGATSSIWTFADSGATLVARNGFQAADLPEGVVYNIQGTLAPRMTFGDGGDVVFASAITGPGVVYNNNTAVFRSIGGQTRLVAREGMTHPDLPEGHAVGKLVFQKIVAPRVNAHGTVAFTASTRSDEFPNGIGHALFVNDDSELRVVAQTGQPLTLPGVPDARLGWFMHSLRDGLINNAGQIAFGTHVVGEGVSQANDEAIVVRQPDGQFSILAREGDPLPGAPGSRMARFMDLRFGGGGHAAFSAMAHTDGSPSRIALLTARADDLRVVAVLNEHTPGIPDDLVMREITFESLTINARGQLAFLGSIGVPGSITTSNSGIWAFDPVAGLFPVALSGDQIEVSPGQVRTVENAYIIYNEFAGNSGGQDGFAGNLSDTGELIFRVTFTNGAQAVFTTIVPTPAAGTLPALAAVLAGRRRREQRASHRRRGERNDMSRSR